MPVHSFFFTFGSVSASFANSESLQQVTFDTFDASGVKTRTERTTFDYDEIGFRVSSLHEIDADADGAFESRTRTEFLADKQNHTGFTQRASGKINGLGGE